MKYLFTSLIILRKVLEEKILEEIRKFGGDENGEK